MTTPEPVTGPGGQAPAGMPPPSPNVCTTGSESWLETVGPNEYRRHYYECANTNNPTARRYFYHQLPHVDICLQPRQAVYAGWRDLSSEPAVGEYGTWLPLWHGCAPPPAPEPPWVDVEGEVLTRVNMGGPERSLAGARYELWCLCRDGTADGTLEWRPVLDGVDDNGRPAGLPVRGYLDGADGYDLRFIYPHQYRLRDGSTWHGCERPEVTVGFMGSFACDPPGTPGGEPPAEGESALQLRVFGNDRDFDIQVVDDETLEFSLVETVHLGLFFERTEEQETVVSVTPAAYAFGAALTVKEVWPRPFPEVLFRLNDTGKTEYIMPRTIMLDRSRAGTSAAEHEVGHHLSDVLYPGNPLLPPGCLAHSFMYSSNAECAWSEGLAHFIALVAEQRYTGAAIVEGTGPLRYYVEQCARLDPAQNLVERCQAGNDVEGRVVAALWDLYDGPEVEAIDSGFVDDVSTSFDGDILSLIATHHPRTIDEFYARWPTKDRDRQVMFMNTLTLVEIRDATAANAVQGSWSDTTCPPCYDKSYARSVAGTPAEMRWALRHVLRDAKYQIWVRLPQGDTDLDTAAAYTIPTANGAVTVTVDQSQAVDGWLNLDPAGFMLITSDETVVTLSTNRSPARELAADALILAPIVE